MDVEICIYFSVVYSGNSYIIFSNNYRILLRMMFLNVINIFIMIRRLFLKVARFFPFQEKNKIFSWFFLLFMYLFIFDL